MSTKAKKIDLMKSGVVDSLNARTIMMAKKVLLSGMLSEAGRRMNFDQDYIICATSWDGIDPDCDMWTTGLRVRVKLTPAEEAYAEQKHTEDPDKSGWYLVEVGKPRPWASRYRVAHYETGYGWSEIYEKECSWEYLDDVIAWWSLPERDEVME